MMSGQLRGTGQMSKGDKVLIHVFLSDQKLIWWIVGKLTLTFNKKNIFETQLMSENQFSLLHQNYYIETVCYH